MVKLLKENEHTAEWLLQEYVQKDANGRYERLYFPKLLSIQEKEDIIEWMLSFKGPELLHYIRYGFEFLTNSGMVSLVSKDSDSSVLERTLSVSGKFSYQTNIAFRYLEAISLLQITALQQVLADEGTNLETSLKAFYEQYLKEKYGYPSGILSLADSTADWVTKCKAIAPEIEAIAHRYDLFAKTGSVDEELLIISSDNVRVTEANSANPGRYYNIKGKPDELYRLFYLFFSDQSMLTFVEPFKEDQYISFFKLLSEQDGKIPYDNYQNYQLRDIDYLIEKGYLSKGDDGMLFVEKPMEISI